ncbi:SEC12-like protein 1 [Carica papaya]|uniref:SEC12-like protein 1 n=1 Tax=Carica papaya TaxID=3649 RepID=UPI000B8C7882|nr:SEC12-like protein 1 [Carica papaya]
MERDGWDNGRVTCGSWIRRPENVNLVVLGKAGKSGSSPSVIEIFSFDPVTTSLSSSPLATHVLEHIDGEPITIAVHPSGDEFVCSTTNGGCKLFELYGRETHLKLLAKELPPLQDVGQQKCLAFSVDGSKFATGGVDGNLRIFGWPSLQIILHEPQAHKSVRDMDFSLDSEFLASTSTDGSARIWKTEDGVPLTTLARNSDEKIELCCFSMDGTKPFLFCSIQRGDKSVTAVYDISTWNKIGHKRLLGKPASTMSISLDGKYLALFCRVVLTTSSEWGATVTKLNVPADWKEWQIYVLLIGLFLASAAAFYIFFENSDSFWNFPLGKNQPRPKLGSFIRDQKSSDDQNMWSAFGPLDM